MKRKAAAIGTFDGVHRGHAAVLECLGNIARGNGLDPVAITFDRHPLEIIAPQRAPKALTTPARKEALIKSFGVQPLVFPFNEQMRNTSARDWMIRLHDELGVSALVVGYDNTFGSDGVNLSLADYRDIGREVGIDVIEAPYVDGISSSAVRKAVAAGNVEKAAEMLGRDFELSGTVINGNHLGRTIGFPTANLLPAPGSIIPAKGVYAAFVILPDGRSYPAVVNIGVRPTVRRGNNLTIEAHIIGWTGDLYGYEIKIRFRRRLRDEITFNSINALRQQIEKDTADTKIILSLDSK